MSGVYLLILCQFCVVHHVSCVQSQAHGLLTCYCLSLLLNDQPPATSLENTGTQPGREGQSSVHSSLCIVSVPGDLSLGIALRAMPIHGDPSFCVCCACPRTPALCACLVSVPDDPSLSPQCATSVHSDVSVHTLSCPCCGHRLRTSTSLCVTENYPD